MDTITVIIFIAIIIIVIICAWILDWQAEQQRQKAYCDWASQHRWNYDFVDVYKTYEHYSFLKQLSRGSNQYAFDILRGTWKGYSAEAFNFHYETYHTSSSTNSEGVTTTTTETAHHYIGVVLIEFKEDFPLLIIYPKNAFEKITSKLGFGKNNVKSIELFQAFNIYCNDNRFVHDFCHPKMIDYLLANPDIELELQSNIAIVYDSRGQMTPADVEKHLVQLYYLRAFLPLQ